MKTKPMILLCGAILLSTASSWIPGVFAANRTSANSLSPIPPQIDYPLNRQCLVTVDPQSSSKLEVAGKANKVTGFVAPDTVEGVLIRMDADWLVLRDRYSENWVPKNKVLMIHVNE